MSTCGGHGREISLGEGFGEVTLQVNGATVEVHADGSIAAHTAGDVDVSTSGSVRTHPPQLTSHARVDNPIAIGDEMPDGTIYAGISPDTHQSMYARRWDEAGVFTFSDAKKHAKRVDAHGRHDFRVPSKGELTLLWENHNKGKLAGTFNKAGSYPAGWYWSSSPYDNGSWVQRFSDGGEYHLGHNNGNRSSLRLVR